MTKTAELRAALADYQPRTAAELAEITGIEQRLVSALLKQDIRAGRVLKSDDWPRYYRMRTPQEAKWGQAPAAVRLLESLGYRVTPPRWWSV